MRLSHEAFGEVAIVRDGDRLITDAVLDPGFPRPPLHVHPGQAERFEVRRGRLRLTVGRSQRVLHPGDAVTVPAGTAHTFAVEGHGPVAMRCEFEPAGDLARFFEGLHRLARDGHIDRDGRPRSLAVAPFALRHLGEFRLARTPAALQRVALGLLTRVSHRTAADT